MSPGLLGGGEMLRPLGIKWKDLGGQFPSVRERWQNVIMCVVSILLTTPLVVQTVPLYSLF